FIAASGRKHPRGLGPSDVVGFLSRLATEGRVSASTQNQALAALLFLYKDVLGQHHDFLDGIVHAQRPTPLPVVLTRDEARALFSALDAPWLLIAKLLYGLASGSWSARRSASKTWTSLVVSSRCDTARAPRIGSPYYPLRSNPNSSITSTVVASNTSETSP